MENENKHDLGYLDVTPNVNFLATLRNSGYNNYAAIADIVDNSLDTNVNSKNVRITIKKNKDEYEFIKIADDGYGMDLETLKEAFKLGALTGKNREFDLGSYGTGLKAAALSIGKAFEVLTKVENGDFYVATYDLDVLLNQNTFNIPIRIGTSDEYSLFKDEINSENGTLIRIYKLDKVSNTNASIFKDILKSKLALYFKYFIDELDVKLFVNNELIESYDPMFRKEFYSKCLTSNEKIIYGNNEIKFSVYNLEGVSKSLSDKIGRNSTNAGLYIYRNKRLVGSGLDLGIVGKIGDGYSNGVRIELFVNGNGDDLFGSTFNKMVHEKDKNDIDQGFKDICRNSIQPYIKTIRSREDQTLNTELSDDIKKELDESTKSINTNRFIDIKKERGINTKRETPTEKKETIKPGSKPNQTRVRDDKFFDYRFINLGENGLMFKTVKEQGLHILEINQEHPFWSKFMSKTNFETKDVAFKLLASLGLALADVEYYNDTEKEIMLTEYFIKVSERLRKFIIY
jgi:hypothetical protein